MNFWVFLAAEAVVSALPGAGPRPVHGPILIRPDYNSSGVVGDAAIDVSFDSTGAIYRCDVVRSSGNKRLDSDSCAAVRRNAPFASARDEQGQPIASVARIDLNWRLTEGIALSGGNAFSPFPVQSIPSAQWARFDMVGRLRVMPPGAKDPTLVGIRRVEGPDGSIESCAVDLPSGNIAIDGFVCRETATNSFGRKPAVDAQGHPIRAMKVYLIVFTARAITHAPPPSDPPKARGAL